MLEPLQQTADGLLFLVALGLLFISLYLVGLSVAALVRRVPRPIAGPAQRRFAVLIPAHNEEALIGRLLQSLRQLDYPVANVDTFVVADNCDDATAQQGRKLGAMVYERFDDIHRAKGFALRWLLEQIQSSGAQYDGFVILDADSVVAPNFLRSMDARLEAGAHAIQAYYSVLNGTDSAVAALRYAALAGVHFLRPLGRAALGLSCGLKGNGMCFSAELLERFSWRWHTLAEDVEFHLALVAHGLRVEFAPETSVLADMPVTLAQASSQNHRWERGRLQLLREQGLQLLVEGVRHRSAVPFDALVEQLIPPLSVPMLVGCVCLTVSYLAGARLVSYISAVGLAGLLGYIFTSLMLVRAPLSIYRAFLFSPVYAAWKARLYAHSLSTRRSTEWVRTTRVPGGGS